MRVRIMCTRATRFVLYNRHLVEQSAIQVRRLFREDGTGSGMHVAVGGKISKPIIIPATARHRAQQVYIHGNPAKCYVDRPIKILRK